MPAALAVAWLALAAVDFGYRVWYDLLDIDATIATYGPQNRNRDGFEHTSRAERLRLFGALVDAIHDHGRGLQRLAYHDAAGTRLGTLLTAPEIVHLRDVAHLVGVLLPVGYGALGGWLLLTLLARRRRLTMPPAAALFAGVLAALVFGALAVLLAGPERSFYALHRWVFPAGHAWFFYYQDSLMTTLMQAPNLFAPIALVWLLLALAVFLALLGFTRRLCPGPRRATR